MKWICVYCNKVMDETNFVDYIQGSDKGEYHGWRRLLSTEEAEKVEEIKEEAQQQFSRVVQPSLV